MSNPFLTELDITNFRSIRGHIHAPLDANVVLIHGENGAGKTSLLSAIELALTGAVQSLQRADAGYASHLLHRSQASGSVVLKTMADGASRTFNIRLDAAGAHTGPLLDGRLASFFSERAYLPQSLLGQLLQIYQDSGSDMESPLARFVGKLLGLDRLDALEAGLKPLADVRNVRRTVDGWSANETERTRLDRLVSDQQRLKQEISDQISANLERLTALCTALGLSQAVGDTTLDLVEKSLPASDDARALDILNDRLRQLAAIIREADQSERPAVDVQTLATDASVASVAYIDWERANGRSLADLRERVAVLLPSVALSSEMVAFGTEATRRLEAAATEASTLASQARAATDRNTAAKNEQEAATRQRDAIDTQIVTLSGDAGSLSSALAELSSFISDDICPMCERDFSETGQGPLHEHVASKVRRLSGSAERLLTLGKSRGEAQVNVERLEREIEVLTVRLVDPKDLAELDRRVADLKALKHDIEAVAVMLQQGDQLLGADIAARRAVAAQQSRDVALLSARETLDVFAHTVAATGIGETENFSDAAARLGAQLNEDNARLRDRLTKQREAGDLIVSIRSLIRRRDEANEKISTDFGAWEAAGVMLENAQTLREQGLAIRNSVDNFRSTIIRREFNDRLNKVWRDLFVRLAPGEPFVPAFSIPKSSTQRLQPKLITKHRFGGDSGGTPGAMLSAGNLNTAALTLFVALHLSVPKELPWLILDDPVQSMDDVHITHFAALLRTLSKEQGRQIMIAVHDRQLFEYLRLELSPAFPSDSLLTLELSRGARRNTICEHRRYHFQDEMILLAAE
jgi:exonuclease SbcC